MGYKHKATMYYSDEETEQFLNEHAHKRNGKKSASHYLYSLVTKERENAVLMSYESNVPSIQIYPEYHPVERVIDGCIEFTSLSNIRDANSIVDIRKKPIHKNIMGEIDEKIKQYMTEKFIDNKCCRIKNDCFIVIRSYISISAHHTHTTAEYCRGNVEVTLLIINVSQDECGRFCSHYNFDMIKYYKHEDIAKASKHVPSSLCKIAEMKPRDPIGAFFIPVMKITRQLSSAFKPGEVIITGVGIYDGVNRMKIKSSNKAQINRFNLRACSHK